MHETERDFDNDVDFEDEFNSRIDDTQDEELQKELLLPEGGWVPVGELKVTPKQQRTSEGTLRPYVWFSGRCVHQQTLEERYLGFSVSHKAGRNQRGRIDLKSQLWLQARRMYEADRGTPETVGQVYTYIAENAEWIKLTVRHFNNSAQVVGLSRVPM